MKAVKREAPYPQIDSPGWTWAKKREHYAELQKMQAYIYQHKSLLSYNSLVGGFGEEATREVYGGTRLRGKTGYDVVTLEGVKLEVKTVDLRHKRGAPSSWTSNDTFDFLVILLTCDLRVVEAWEIPAKVLSRYAKQAENKRWWIPTDKYSSIPEAVNITKLYENIEAPASLSLVV